MKKWHQCIIACNLHFHNCNCNSFTATLWRQPNFLVLTNFTCRKEKQDHRSSTSLVGTLNFSRKVWCAIISSLSFFPCYVKVILFSILPFVTLCKGQFGTHTHTHTPTALHLCIKLDVGLCLTWKCQSPQCSVAAALNTNFLYNENFVFSVKSIFMKNFNKCFRQVRWMFRIQPIMSAVD